MNTTISKMLEHRSIRSYKDERISDEHIESILSAARSSANSINGQSYTIIEVRDLEKKKALVDIASKQKWILPASHFFIFCIDFSRAVKAGEKMDKANVMVNQTEAIMLSATDIGIAIGHATVAAESLGYGVVPIGAVRNNPKRIIEILELPEYVFPMVGFVVGVIGDYSDVKPKFTKEVMLHIDKYDKSSYERIEAYDQQISTYMEKRTAGKSRRNWTETTATAFSAVRHPDVTEVLKSQGFKLL